MFDEDEHGWWIVGDFSYWYLWEPAQAERFLELREIISYRSKEIVVRETSGGSNAWEIGLSIYRMHGRFLYRIFNTDEEIKGQ